MGAKFKPDRIRSENRTSKSELAIYRPDTHPDRAHPDRAHPEGHDKAGQRVMKSDSNDARDPGLELELDPSDSLLGELDEANRRLGSGSAEEILVWAVSRFGSRFTMATAFGPEGMCLIHMLAELAPATPIFNLDTGYQFPETLEMRQRVLDRYGMAVEFKRPVLSVEEFEAANGGPVYTNDPDRCCNERKLTVLHEAIKGKHAWASAIRRDQSPDRELAPIIGWDARFKLVKVSPLANWTRADVWSFIRKHDVPYNPLHDQGYLSVGCRPCTRSVMAGDDERSGRWCGFKKTECGLHSLND